MQISQKKSWKAGLVLVILLFGNLLNFTSTPNSSATTESTLDTQFYKFKVVDLQVPAQWVANLSRDGALALSSDSGFFDKPPQLGGTNPNYNLFFKKSEGDWNKIANINFVTSGFTRYRILDFKTGQFNPSDDLVSRTSILISMAAWDASLQCRFLTIYQKQISLKYVGDYNLDIPFFKSPCLPENSPDGKIVGPALHLSGGRIVFAERKDWLHQLPTVYLTIGDFELMANPVVKISKTVENFLTSVVFINSKGESQPIARGLRNPEGAAMAFYGGVPRLVTSSHGPRGGAR